MNRESTTRHLLQWCNGIQEPFAERFGFYLDSLDRMYHLQGRIGLDEPALAALPDQDQKRFKTYLFLTESINTTSTGALRLFAGNLYCDSFALLRVIYEVASLMHYGNGSSDDADEVYRTLFRGTDDTAHTRGEWDLIRKAQARLEGEEPGLALIRQRLNNFGSHTSRAKIFLGNVGTLGNRSASTVFAPNFTKREYLMGLDILHCLLMLALDEYDKQAASYPGAFTSVAKDIASHNRHFAAEVRPRLQAMMGET